MPYIIVFQKGSSRPWKIKRKDTGKVVGSSITKKAAQSSVLHRTEEVAKKRKKKRRPIEDMA
jgi:hypothetical protein